MKKRSGPSQVTSIRLSANEREAADRLKKRLKLRTRSEAIKEAVLIALEATAA